MLTMRPRRVLIRAHGAPSGVQEIPSANAFEADCKAHVYSGITQWKIDEIVRRLTSQGATIAGANPWTADMHQHGVVLYGHWNATTQQLYVDIKAISRTLGFPTCAQVWGAVDPQIAEVQVLQDPVNPQPAPGTVPAPSPPPAPAPSPDVSGQTPDGATVAQAADAAAAAASDASAVGDAAAPTLSMGDVLLLLLVATSVPVALGWRD
jgi:hypothetical protein